MFLSDKILAFFIYVYENCLVLALLKFNLVKML